MFCLFSVSSAVLLPLRFSAPPHSVVTCACDHFFSKLCANRSRGVLGISSDGDDRRILGGLKFSIPGFVWVRKFGKYFFG